MNREIRGINKVTQGHGLIESLRDAHPLTLQESRIVFTAISTLQPHDTIFDSQRIAVRDLLKICGMSENNHKVIEKACSSLFGKGIRLRDGKSWTIYPWFQKIKYLHNEGAVEFQFPNDLQKFLLDLKKEDGFTSFSLENILRLSSFYHQRIYELCYKWKTAGSFQFDLEHLKNMVGAVENSYKVYGNFKRRILNPAILEINEKTDIAISFEEIKQGRKVVAIKFYIEDKNKKTKKKSETQSSGFKPRQKIIREEQIPTTFEKRNTEPDNIFGKFSKEEIDIMRKELIIDLQKSKEENSNK